MCKRSWTVAPGPPGGRFRPSEQRRDAIFGLIVHAFSFPKACQVLLPAAGLFLRALALSDRASSKPIADPNAGVVNAERTSSE
jgi:hypothetical protein